jgi:hypothetical protein
VAQDFAGKPVVVLGMNNDGKVDDAKFVVKAMDIPYMTLRSPFEAAKEFDIQLYPCVLVIDAKGIIRDLDEGYSPTLRTDLDKKIQSLLDSGAE